MLVKAINRDIIFQIKEKKYLQKEEILLLVGARQVGKTTILKLLQRGLEAEGNKTFFKFRGSRLFAFA